MKTLDFDMTVRELVESGGEAKTPQRVRSDKAYKAKLAGKQDSKEFIQVKDKGVKQVSKTLTLTQAGTLLSLMAYVSNNKGHIYFNGKRLGTEQLAKLLNTSKASLQRNVSELVSLGYVIAEKQGRSIVYSVNTQLAIKGEKTDKDFFSKLYFVGFRELLKKLTVQEAGMLFLMIPYFNTKFYTLCKNPYELDANKVELFDRERFAEETGISLDHTKRLIASLLKKGGLVGIKTCRTALVISPRIVSRNNFASLEQVLDVIENELNVRERMEW